MLCFRKIPEAKNSMDIRRVVKIFRRNVFVSQCRKLSQENPFVLCFRKLPVSKEIMHMRGGGGITIYRGKIFVSDCRKVS